MKDPRSILWGFLTLIVVDKVRDVPWRLFWSWLWGHLTLIGVKSVDEDFLWKFPSSLLWSLEKTFNVFWHSLEWIRVNTRNVLWISSKAHFEASWHSLELMRVTKKKFFWTLSKAQKLRSLDTHWSGCGLIKEISCEHSLKLTLRSLDSHWS